MKNHILRLEQKILGLVPIRILVWLIRKFAFRIMWLWGRIRFGAMVPHRGLGCVCAWDADLKYPDNIILGNRVIIGSRVSIGAHSTVELGDNVRISRDVLIETAGLDFSDGTPPYKHLSKPIRIEKGVWIGARAIILGGVTIGENAVVAAGSVVTRSIGAEEVVAGVPARTVKKMTNHVKD